MGQVLHGSGRAAEATRLAIQHSQESVRVLAAWHGISRLAEVRDKPARSKFKAYAIGYVHIDPWTDLGLKCAPKKASFSCSLSLDGACVDQLDRTSKLAFVRLETKATRMVACQFLRDLIDAFPYHPDQAEPSLE